MPRRLGKTADRSVRDPVGTPCDVCRPEREIASLGNADRLRLTVWVLRSRRTSMNDAAMIPVRLEIIPHIVMVLSCSSCVLR